MSVCAIPQPPANGRIQVVSESERQARVVKYSCIRGYSLMDGSEYRICQNYGFDGKAPSCVSETPSWILTVVVLIALLIIIGIGAALFFLYRRYRRTLQKEEKVAHEANESIKSARKPDTNIHIHYSDKDKRKSSRMSVNRSHRSSGVSMRSHSRDVLPHPVPSGVLSGQRKPSAQDIHQFIKQSKAGSLVQSPVNPESPGCSPGATVNIADSKRGQELTINLRPSSHNVSKNRPEHDFSTQQIKHEEPKMPSRQASNLDVQRSINMAAESAGLSISAQSSAVNSVTRGQIRQMRVRSTRLRVLRRPRMQESGQFSVESAICAGPLTLPNKSRDPTLELSRRTNPSMLSDVQQ